MGSGTSIGIKRATATRSTAAERAEWHRRASRLYEELRGPAAALIRRAYGATFGDDEIDDVYSSAWLGTLRALERRQAGLRDDEIRNYVLAAVANQASKEIRRRRRKPVAPIDAAGATPDGALGPEEAATARESSQVTRDLLASLPPRRRAVMLLRYGWGLDPRDVCGMVDGLTPRAYRKEITKGVDELTAKVKLVEEGRWCADREPLLKTYASGLADKEEVLQAEQHLAHCRHCHEFVGKLTGHLHDLGGAMLVPGALEAIDPSASLIDRLSGAGDRARETAAGLIGRSEPAEAVPALTSARGAGAAGAGLAAKLAGLGTAGKVAFACLSGGAAATACVAAGIGPVSLDGIGDSGPAQAAVSQPAEEAPPIDPPRDPTVVETPATTAPDSGGDPVAEAPEPTPAEPPVAPEAPPVHQEFGVESAAAPAPSAPTSSSGGGGSGGSAVQQEFGP